MENDYFWEITFSEAPSNDFFAHLMKSCLCKAVTFTEKEMKKKRHKKRMAEVTAECSVCSFFVHFFLFRPGEYPVCLFFVHSFLFRTLLSMFVSDVLRMTK